MSEPTTQSASSEFLAETRTYLRFLRWLLGIATDGTAWFYAWMIGLTAVFLVGANAWAVQVTDGMIVTHMTDHVSWGLYIANFTFAVGLAAGGVMMVIPAYLYRDHKMHDVVIVGELLAIASIVVCLMFVTADLGRPDRFWHLIPGIGRFNFPLSMLTWDVIRAERLPGLKPARLRLPPLHAISETRAESQVVCSVCHGVRFSGRSRSTPSPRFCTADFGGRPFWNSALLAPRFLASAFVSGPAFIILTLLILRRLAKDRISMEPIRLLTNIVRVTLVINLFMVVSEFFTEFYTGGAHTAAAQYLLFGHAWT